MSSRCSRSGGRRKRVVIRSQKSSAVSEPGPDGSSLVEQISRRLDIGLPVPLTGRRFRSSMLRSSDPRSVGGRSPTSSRKMVPASLTPSVSRPISPEMGASASSNAPGCSWARLCPRKTSDASSASRPSCAAERELGAGPGSERACRRFGPPSWSSRAGIAAARAHQCDGPCTVRSWLDRRQPRSYLQAPV